MKGMMKERGKRKRQQNETTTTKAKRKIKRGKWGKIKFSALPNHYHLGKHASEKSE